MSTQVGGPGVVTPPPAHPCLQWDPWRLRRLPAGSLILLTALAAASCTGSVSDSANADASGSPLGEPRAALEEEVSMSDTTIIAAQEALTPTVMALPGVVGTAVGLCDGSPCIQVLVAAPDSVLLAQLPERFQGHQVDVRVVGDIRAQDTTDASRKH